MRDGIAQWSPNSGDFSDFSEGNSLGGGEGGGGGGISHLPKFIHRTIIYKYVEENIQNFQLPVFQTHNHLKGTEAPECEMRLMDKVLPLTFYNQEMHNVRSDAQPGLKRLTLTLGPIGK